MDLTRWWWKTRHSRRSSVAEEAAAILPTIHRLPEWRRATLGLLKVRSIFTNFHNKIIQFFSLQPRGPCAHHSRIHCQYREVGLFRPASSTTSAHRCRTVGSTTITHLHPNWRSFSDRRRLFRWCRGNAGVSTVRNTTHSVRPTSTTSAATVWRRWLFARKRDDDGWTANDGRRAVQAVSVGQSHQSGFVFSLGKLINNLKRKSKF